MTYLSPVMAEEPTTETPIPDAGTPASRRTARLITAPHFTALHGGPPEKT